MFAEESCVLSLEKRGLWFKTFPGRKKKKKKKEGNFHCQVIPEPFIKAEGDKGMMQSCPTDAQISSSMARPAALCSPLQIHLPKGGVPTQGQCN